MKKALNVLIAVIIAAMLCGCADDVSSSVGTAGGQLLPFIYKMDGN